VTITTQVPVGGDVRTAPPYERHVAAVGCHPGGDVRPGTAAVHGHVRGRVAAAGERQRRTGDRVSHQVANDYHACHTRHHLIAGHRFYYRSGQRARAASGGADIRARMPV
jgi:hypothetical protein